MFGFGKSYTTELLASKDAVKFAEGIMKDPKRFFAEAKKTPKTVLRNMAGVLELASHQLGQSALLLSLTAALKVAANDKRAPKDAAQLAKKLSDDLIRAFKSAGQ